MTNLMLSLVYCGSEGTSHKSSGIDVHRCQQTCSPDAHLMNVMERPPPYGCTTSECDGLTCGSVVSTTAQYRNVTNHPTVKQDSGDCIERQEAPQSHHSNKYCGPGNGRLLMDNIHRITKLLTIICNKMTLDRLKNRT